MMNYIAYWTVIALICQMIPPKVNGECFAAGATSAVSTINAPVLDSQNIVFMTNSFPEGPDDTRVLSFRIKWWTVSNRILTWAGIGDESAADGGCVPFVHSEGDFMANGGWSYTPSDDCYMEIRANYSWPKALLNPSCNSLFTTDETDPSFVKVSFDIIVKFKETFLSLEPGTNINRTREISAKHPVTLSLPKNVSVVSSIIDLYSAYLDLGVDMVSQNVSVAPYQFNFVTYHNRSFALDRPSVAFYGKMIPFDTSVTCTEDLFDQGYRYSFWNLSITPQQQSCFLTGFYRISLNLYWTGLDSNGFRLPQSQNPLPNNSTITFTIKIQSQSLCPPSVYDKVTNWSLKISSADYGCLILHICMIFAIVISAIAFVVGCLCGCTGGIVSARAKRKFATYLLDDENAHKEASSVTI